MFKYLWRAQKPLFIILLIDLIIFGLIIFISIVTGFEDYLIKYQASWQIQFVGDFYYIFNIIRNVFSQLQLPLILISIFYLFSGSRLTQMFKTLGKGKSTQLLAILLLISGSLSYYIRTVQQITILNFYGPTRYLNVPLWFGFVAILLIYLLLFHSNLKYHNWLIKGAITVTIGISSYMLFIIQYYPGIIYFSFNSYEIPQIENMFAPIQVITLPSYIYNLETLIITLVVLLTTTLTCGLVLKKVGN